MPRTRARDAEAAISSREDLAPTSGPAGPETGEPDYIEQNRAAWERWAPGYLGSARKAWQDVDLKWGIWGTSEEALGLFAGVKTGQDAIELGCGTAEVSAWLARRGVRPVAVDIASRQIQNVESLQSEFDVSFPTLCANAEDVHFEDDSFDLAISEYGASLWCEPERWIPEAHRLLRPGGRLIFFTNSALLMMCTPPGGGVASERLMRDFFSSARLVFEEGGAVEFHSSHGNWVRLLQRWGFVLENLIEVRPRAEARGRYKFVTLEWARRWPSEEIWIARKMR
jgi:SAM-dependent methyltransferase